MGCCFHRPRALLELPDDSLTITSSLIDRRRRRTLAEPSLFSLVDPTRLYLDHSRSSVTWRRADHTVVGLLNVIIIELICRNNVPYTVTRTDYFQVDVLNAVTDREVNCIIEPRTLEGVSSIRVSYTVRVSGDYTIVCMMNGQILDQVYTRHYIAGPPDPNKTVFHYQTANLIFTCDTFYAISFSPKDVYDNVATVDRHELLLEVRKGGPDGVVIYPECVTNLSGDDEERCEMLIKLNDPGYYKCCVKYSGCTIGLNDAIVICLTKEDTVRMENNLTAQFLTISYTARLCEGSRQEIKCYISPRLFQVRGYTLIFISKRLFTCRVCNSTQFTLLSEKGKFIIDDGLQPPITLLSTDRELIAAIYYQFIERNIGGVRSFTDKLRHFQEELRLCNPDYDNRLDVRLTIKRFNLLESSIQATRGFNIDMWKRQFSVQFEGESGIDIGGVSREFINCLCDTLFSGRNSRGLFKSFSNDTQSLVHPNYWRKRDSQFTLEHYRFAGRVVGKCLYDTAIGNRLLVKAKFTRSFLAQIIGLRLSWKHFETDDPELYRYKVKSIRESSIEDLDLSLTFAEEEFEKSGIITDPKLISITPGGTKTHVTDSNKMEYLNHLAQYRLAKCITDEMREFLKGLHEMIPDNLLGMFDENELELLMCGLQELSVDDLQTNIRLARHTDNFRIIVEWFWTVLREFSQEELARLVQFVTGSSQIPSGGFRELIPPFLLAPSGEVGYRLPYAHTCFNHLCLPNYDTYEQFRTALMTAINEGSEGVLLT